MGGAGPGSNGPLLERPMSGSSRGCGSRGCQSPAFLAVVVGVFGWSRSVERSPGFAMTDLRMSSTSSSHCKVYGSGLLQGYKEIAGNSPYASPLVLLSTCVFLKMSSSRLCVTIPNDTLTAFNVSAHAVHLVFNTFFKAREFSVPD